MTYPTVAVATANLDAGTDSPATARSDLLDAVQKLNQMIAHTTAFAATLLDDANAVAARATLGAAVSGANDDITSMTGLSNGGIPLAKVSGAAASGVNNDITSLGALSAGGLPDGSVTTNDIAGSAVTAAKLSGGQSGSAPVYGCRAWCVFDGTLTGTNAPTSGGNVTSVTRNSTGNYTVNFGTALPSASYAVLVTCKSNDTNTHIGEVVEFSTPTTSAVNIRTNSHTSTLTDIIRVYVAVFC